MADPRFENNTKRNENVDLLEDLIEDVLKTQNMSYWLEKCEEAGVPAGPINNFEDAMNDEHFISRDMIQEIEHPIIGKMKTIASPTKFSETPCEIRFSSPTIGQNTDEVLSSIGFKSDQLSLFREQGVIK
ncbi:CoA transferase [Bacillus fonticola]|uniref:CoA transferase n=1 Tax=Bacillus fonticola TaxID=2728853 RepID=UPI001D14209A|nr:CoA transferase [Bacillus fonticola]